MEIHRVHILGCLLVFICILSVGICEETSEEKKDEPVVVDIEKGEYAKGSMCGYCDYCKFCKLCDDDCPCETGPTKPNCKMCKYCKYCYLCSGLCDTVCKPGGYIDTVSSAIINALPFGDKDEIDGDINSMKTWIDQKKDEL